jgi:flagellar basal-body rod protein FlgF
MKEIYRVLTAVMGLEKRLDQIANNLSNINTPGFKMDGAAFVDYLKTASLGQTGQRPETPAVSPENSATAGWPILAQAYVDLSQGPIERTGRDLDVAIEGEGFFVVQIGEGQEPCYTRAGNFAVGPDGELLTADGRPVLDAGGGPIRLGPARGRIEIAEDGTIRAGDAIAGKLGVVRFEDPTKLERYGYGLFRAPQGMDSQPVETPRLRQGALEGSNVNVIDEMVRMIQTQRTHQVQQKIIQTIDELTSRRIESANS